MRRRRSLVLAVIALASAMGAAVAGHASSVSPAPSVPFVVTCEFVKRANDDPIRHPGHAGMSHSHDFFGNQSIGSNADIAELKGAKSSCDNPGDRASYWIPSLQTGATWASRMRAYYSAGLFEPGALVPYPVGLQMIGGSSSATSAKDSVSFSCGRGLDEAGWSPVPVPCTVPLRVRVAFPQCWDGKTLQAPGNVVYPKKGRCPKGYAVPVPLLRLVFTLSQVTGTTTFQTSAGGASAFHADFFNAWDPYELRTLIDTCNKGMRASNREIKRCKGVGTGPRAVGGPDSAETNF